MTVERKHPLAKCEECPLYAEPGPVLGAGPAGPVKVAVVGEAPGFVEATTGRPFAGPTGQVLNEFLRNNEIDRADVYTTNAVLCRPPKNATPTQDAIDACSDRLRQEITSHSPEYILAMGAVGAKALGLKGAMQKLRIGPPKRITLVDDDGVLWDYPTIPTWHPAFAMRKHDIATSIDFDISKINKGTTVSDWTEPTLTIVDGREPALLAIKDLWEIPGPFSVDIETGVEKDDLDVHADQRPLLCIGIGYELGKVVVFGKHVMDDLLIMNCLAKLFREKPLIMHNGKSDVAGLIPTMGAVNLAFDTLLEHYTLDERTGGHRLEEVGVELLGVPPWKDMVKPYLAKGKDKNFADIPLPLLYKYNAIDCDVTYRLHFLLYPRIQEQGRTKLPDQILVPAANQLVYPEMDGIGFDMEYSNLLTVRLQAELAALAHRINEYLGQEINPGSPQQLVRLFTEREWHLPTKKGSPTTAAPELKRALEEGLYDEEAQGFLELLFEYRDLAKDDGTFTRGMQKQAVEHVDGTHRIHTTYTLHVATTGRLSSRDPNLQNIKDKDYLRRQFIAGPGNTFLQGDYSQVEGRVIAVLSGDKYLGDLFRNADRDIFDELSVAMYGKLIKEKRRLLKTFFYGIAYERTEHGISKGFGIPLDEAKAQLDQFKSLIPGVIEWQEATWQLVQDQGYLETTFGRRRHFPLITNRNAADIRREAMAFQPQSTASDICLRAFTDMRPGLAAQKQSEDIRIRLTIHDAIVNELPIEKLDYAKELMSGYMLMSGNRWSREQGSDIPFKVAFKSGQSWDQLGDD